MTVRTDVRVADASALVMSVAAMIVAGCGACVAAPVRADSGERELLANGSFEIGRDGPDGWHQSWRRTLAGMTPPERSWAENVARTGKRSVRIYHARENFAGQFAYWSTNLPAVKPNTWYELSGYVKLDGVGGGGVYLALGKALSLPQLGASHWKLVRVVTKTGPEDQALKAVIEGQRFYGTAWFDDLSVVELADRPAGFPNTQPKRSDEVVSVWVHCSQRWGVRPFPRDSERQAKAATFDPQTFHRDLNEFFAIMEKLGVTDLYGIPHDANWYRDKWHVELPADCIYLKECEKRGIRAFAEIGGFLAPKASSDEYACRDESGNVVRGWCLTRPKVRDHTLRVSLLPCIERIRRYRAKGYRIAGVCTDGVRWATTKPCQCELCNAEYAKVKDSTTLDQFRCEQVTTYVRAVRAELDKVDRDLLLVGAVKAGNSLRFGQDTPRWLREGTYDYIMPMAYGGPGSWVMTINFLTNQAGVDPKKIVMLTALYRVGPAPTVTQIALAKERGILGYSFFGWRTRYYTWPYVKQAAPRWTQMLAEAINSPRPR